MRCSSSRLRLALLGAVALAPAMLGACAKTGGGILTGTPSLNTARVALSGGSPGVAFEICDRQGRDRPRDPDFLVCKGDALAMMNRPSEAVAAYNAALAVDSSSSNAQLGLGRLRLATDPAGAEALFLQALSRNPRNTAALNNLGISRDLQGRHGDAQTAYGEAIALAPDLRAPQVNLALSLAMIGRSREAVQILRPIADRADATARERHDMAAVLAMDGQPDQAAQLLQPELDNGQANTAVNGYRALRVP